MTFPRSMYCLLNTDDFDSEHLAESDSHKRQECWKKMRSDRGGGVQCKRMQKPHPPLAILISFATNIL